MHQTRQFTKRRPQSPMLHQQQAVEGLQVGAQKSSRGGLAIQSSAPIHTRSFKSEQQEPLHQDHTALYAHDHLNQQDHFSHHAPTQVHHADHLQAHHHDHGNHSHDHHGHDHHNHAYHGHDHHGHDHHGHDHHDHHGHAHHDHHDHHDHHGHDHHGHDHHGHHHFPQVYTQPLPSYASIFATLAPFQKTLFTFFVLYFLLGISVWWSGLARESLAVVGFSYLVLFDAFGVLNLFASNVLQLNPAFTQVTTKRPFGARRFEIVLALANTIFLLFGTMYTTKESLEHLLLENHHPEVEHHHGLNYPFGLLFLLLLAISGSVFSSVNLKNHQPLVQLMKQSHYDHTHGDMNALSVVKNNLFSLSIVASGSFVFLVYLLGMATPNLDKMIAFGEAGLMLYLGIPTAVALSKVLLQTMPDSLVNSIGHQLRQVQQQVPYVISVDKVHFWQNAYGRLIGTVEIHVRPEAEEDAVINGAFSLLESVVRDNGGELTISVVKP
ncbi:cation efflux family-domain-containing protein [Choanephora cucurbitarum]|nr:cation efflux family-domain-containing protein [Choanephora cucurbitarum]